MKKLFLIGGAPLAGKTTHASNLAKTVPGAVSISTDNIRDIMRATTSIENFPKLNGPANYTVDKYYDVYSTPELAMREEIEQGEEVEAGIVAYLESNPQPDVVIIEGIAVSPKFCVDIQKRFSSREIHSLILLHKDKNSIEKRIVGRGLWGRAGTYPAKYIPIELEWTYLYDRWFWKQAQNHGVATEVI